MNKKCLVSDARTVENQPNFSELIIIIIIIIIIINMPTNVLDNDNFKLYWNRSILTDKTIPFLTDLI